MKIEIVTSSWSTKLPPEIQRIGISRGMPRGQPGGYRMLKELAPGPYFNSLGPAEYHRRFMEQLKALDARVILAKIEELSGAKTTAALLCFEKPNDPSAWCHRGQVAGWFADELGIKVCEYGLESAGSSWQHPKLLPEFRRPPK